MVTFTGTVRESVCAPVSRSETDDDDRDSRPVWTPARRRQNSIQIKTMLMRQMLIRPNAILPGRGGKGKRVGKVSRVWISIRPHSIYVYVRLAGLGFPRISQCRQAGLVVHSNLIRYGGAVVTLS